VERLLLPQFPPATGRDFVGVLWCKINSVSVSADGFLALKGSYVGKID
jgi:hypothetical protein